MADPQSAGSDTAGSVHNKLRSLPAGSYTLHVENYITYDFVSNQLTGERSPSNVLLAAGKLPLELK